MDDTLQLAPWAITEEAMQRMATIAAEQDPEKRRSAMQAILGPKRAVDAQPYDVVDGIALVEVSGVISKRPYWGDSAGATLTIRKNIQAALDDAAVEAILLQVDSPGGTVDGTAELAEFVFQARESKPVFAYADGLMCSAAYWIGSAAQQVFAPATAQVGSIGVLMAHMDISRLLEDWGVKITFLHAGEDKVLGNYAEPLSDKARAYFQSRLDEIYGLFLDAVAKHRGVSRGQAADMAEGRVFHGREAMRLGLVDAIMNLDQAVQHIKEELSMDMSKLDAAALRASRPDLVQAIEADAVEKAKVEQDKTNAEAVSAARQEGATMERERVVAVVTALMGEEVGSKLASVAASGVTAEQVQTLSQALPRAEGKDTMAAMLDALHASHEEPLQTGSAPRTASSDPKAQWDADEGLRAEFGGDFDRYASFTKAQGEGRARVLSKADA